jgi:hypothetical protein
MHRKPLCFQPARTNARGRRVNPAEAPADRTQAVVALTLATWRLSLCPNRVMKSRADQPPARRLNLHNPP